MAADLAESAFVSMRATVPALRADVWPFAVGFTLMGDTAVPAVYLPSPFPAPAAPIPPPVPGLGGPAAYSRNLAQLLPPGVLWNLELTSPLSGVLRGAAEEFARVEARGADLVEESDPRTANETIADWERTVSLPDDFVTAIPATLAGRRVAVTQKLTSRVGQNLAFYAQLCAACGYPLVSVTKYAIPLRIGFHIGDHLTGTAWGYTITITVSPATAGALTHAQFEAVVRHATHSHINVNFTYT